MTKEKFIKKLGQTIRSLRQAKGMTQEQVASYGIDVKQYQRIERGLVNPTGYTLYLLTQAFECSADTLLVKFSS